MKFSLLTILLGALLLIGSDLASADDAPESPFNGWTAKQINEHSDTAERKIKLIVRRWTDARDELVVRCPKCGGTGFKVVHRPRAAAVKVPCSQCNRTGGYVSKKDFLRVFWEYFSRAYKTPQRQKLLERQYVSAQADPARAIADLGQIERHRRMEIEVLGNHARLAIEVKRGGLWQEEVYELIEDVPDVWCIRHEEADRDFVEFDYPQPTPDAEAAGENGKPGQTPESDNATNSPSPKAPDQQETIEDPAKLFEITQVAVRHIEEDAWKVYGTIKNITADRRFAYLVVEVGIYLGDELIETASCNVGISILKPGDTATFSGYVYLDGELKHDRLEAKVVKFTKME